MVGDETSDPFEPVEGVTLERYAEVAVAVFGATGDEIEARARAHGIPAGRLQAVAEGWSQRMAQHPQVVHRYSELYQRALKKAGIEPPDTTFEQYADILRRQQAGEPLPTILSEHGLDLQTFALVAQRWIDRMATDPSLAVRLAEVLGRGLPSA